MEKKLIILLFVMSHCASLLYAQVLFNSSFWEKVDTKIINQVTGTPKTIGEIRLEGTLHANGTGAMILLFGNIKPTSFNAQPLWSYVSNDGGNTWEYLPSFTKYNGYYITTSDLSSSGKYFITGSYNIGVPDGKPVYFFSTDGKNWSAVNKSDLMDKSYFGTGSHSIVEAKNRKLSEYLNLYPGDIGDAGASYHLHKIYYPDGSIKTLQDDKFDESKRSTNMANFYSLQKATGTYVRGNPVGDYQVIREAYYTCDGKYFANIGGGISMISNDDISYKIFNSGLFISTPSMREKYFPICNALFAIGRVPSNEIKLYVKVKNGDWEDTGYYSGVRTLSSEPKIIYNHKTKRFYIFNNFKFGYTTNNENGTLLQSKKTYECDCGSTSAPLPEVKKITYGTTVITHGFQLDGEPPFKDKDWAFQMALEVLKNAENGTIYTYNKKTGNYDESITLADGKKGEKILLYDWASESNNNAPGYSEAAGDALFTSLLLGFKKEQFGLSNIHFIGHSRGTVVNTLASERLLVLKSNYPDEYKDKILIDQVTNISPHDWGIAVSFDDIDAFDLKSVSNKQYVLAMSDLNDAHPDINIDEPIDYKPNNGVIAWKGLFNDTYLQEHGKLIEKKKWEKSISVEDLIDATKAVMTTKNWVKIVWEGIKMYVQYNFNIEYTNLNDRRVAGSHNTLWADDEKGEYTLHAGERGVYNVYNKTIKGMPPLYGSGYQFSRLAKKKIQRPNDGYGLGIPTFDFYKNMNLKGKNNSRILGIVNGSFDRFYDIHAPGWSKHGGAMLGESNITTDNHGIKKGKPAFEFSNGYVTMNYLKSAKPMILRHNRFYVPIDAKNIGFKMKTQNLKDGTLDIYINNVSVYKEPIGSIPNFIDITLDESKFQIYRDKVITLEFQFCGNPIQNNELPVLSIDEVKLIKGISTNYSTTNPKNTVEKLNTQNAQINKTQEATKIESTKIKENTTKSGRVKTKEGSDLMLRAEPSIKASIIAEIPNRKTVNILEYSDKIVELNGEIGRWCKVDYDGKIGWAWEKFIETTISQAIVQTKSGYVKTKEGSDLRLRSAPSEKASIITQIANGSKVIILEKDDHFVTVNGDVGQWLKVKYEGTIGWAWGKFIIQN